MNTLDRKLKNKIFSLIEADELTQEGTIIFLTWILAEYLENNFYTEYGVIEISERLINEYRDIVRLKEERKMKKKKK